MGMIYGYPRVSTPKQNIERQIKNITDAYPNARLFPEVYTGTTSEGRPVWQKLLKRVQPGDCIVFDSVSRMSRNAEEGFADYEKLYNKGIKLVFLKEPHINTEVFRQALTKQIALTGTNVDLILEGINNYLMEIAREQIRLAFGQSAKEVEDLRQRTIEGIRTAVAHGKKPGRPGTKKYNTQKGDKAKSLMRRICKEFGGDLNDINAIKYINNLFPLSRNTYYKYKQEIRMERMENLMQMEDAEE